jgi:hypothetical protein
LKKKIVTEPDFDTAVSLGTTRKMGMQNNIIQCQNYEIKGDRFMIEKI